MVSCLGENSNSAVFQISNPVTRHVKLQGEVTLLHSIGSQKSHHVMLHELMHRQMNLIIDLTPSIYELLGKHAVSCPSLIDDNV